MCIYIDDTHIYVYSETFMKEREKEKQLVSPTKNGKKTKTTNRENGVPG